MKFSDPYRSWTSMSDAPGFNDDPSASDAGRGAEVDAAFKANVSADGGDEAAAELNKVAQAGQKLKETFDGTKNTFRELGDETDSLVNKTKSLGSGLGDLGAVLTSLGGIWAGWRQIDQ